MDVVSLVLHVIWDCSPNRNACGCYAGETLISGDVFILADGYLCRVCLPCGEGGVRSNLSPMLLSLAEVLGFCPARARFRAQLKVWMEFTQSTWDFASLALFFLISSYLWLLWTLSVVPPERKPGVCFLIGSAAGQPSDESSEPGELSHPSSFSQFLTPLLDLPAFVHFR